MSFPFLSPGDRPGRRDRLGKAFSLSLVRRRRRRARDARRGLDPVPDEADDGRVRRPSRRDGLLRGGLVRPGRPPLRSQRLARPPGIGLRGFPGRPDPRSRPRGRPRPALSARGVRGHRRDGRPAAGNLRVSVPHSTEFKLPPNLAAGDRRQGRGPDRPAARIPEFRRTVLPDVSPDPGSSMPRPPRRAPPSSKGRAGGPDVPSFFARSPACGSRSRGGSRGISPRPRRRAD